MFFNYVFTVSQFVELQLSSITCLKNIIINFQSQVYKCKFLYFRSLSVLLNTENLNIISTNILEYINGYAPRGLEGMGRGYTPPPFTKIAINLPWTYMELLLQRRTISVQQLPRSFSTNTQTYIISRHHVTFI